jgi:hypothetical protein
MEATSGGGEEQAVLALAAAARKRTGANPRAVTLQRVGCGVEQSVFEERDVFSLPGQELSTAAPLVRSPGVHFYRKLHAAWTFKQGTSGQHPLIIVEPYDRPLRIKRSLSSAVPRTYTPRAGRR